MSPTVVEGFGKDPISKELFLLESVEGLNTIQTPSVDWEAVLEGGPPTCDRRTKRLQRAVSLIASSNVEAAGCCSTADLAAILQRRFDERAIGILLAELASAYPEWLTVSGSKVLFSTRLSSQQVLSHI